MCGESSKLYYSVSVELSLPLCNSISVYIHLHRLVYIYFSSMQRGISNQRNNSINQSLSLSLSVYVHGRALCILDPQSLFPAPYGIPHRCHVPPQPKPDWDPPAGANVPKILFTQLLKVLVRSLLKGQVAWLRHRSPRWPGHGGMME